MKQLISKYTLIGLVTVLIDLSVLYLSHDILHIDYIFSILLGFVAANIFQFYTNFYYTFSLTKDNNMQARVLVYILLVLFGVSIFTFIIIWLKSIFTSLYIAKFISLFLNYIYGFTVSKYIIYNKNLFTKRTSS